MGNPAGYRLASFERWPVHVPVPFDVYYELRKENIAPKTTAPLTVHHIPMLGFSGFGNTLTVSVEQIVCEYAKILVTNRLTIAWLVRRVLRDQQPFAIGCLAGKDRTGVVCYALLRAWGVTLPYIADDYAQSQDALKKDMALFNCHWERKGLTREDYKRRLYTPEEVIFRLDGWLLRQFGSIYGYLG